MSQLDTVIGLLAEAVPEAIKQMHAYLVYQGDNPRYHQKAKVGGVLVGSYVKAEGTKTNRMAVLAATDRMKRLPAA